MQGGGEFSSAWTVHRLGGKVDRSGSKKKTSSREGGPGEHLRITHLHNQINRVSHFLKEKEKKKRREMLFFREEKLAA